MVDRHLRRSGWTVLARRLATVWGEIDLVAVDGSVLVCVEVKTGRAGPRHRPGARLRRNGLRRLWRAARGLGRELGRRAVRVDLVEVMVEARRPRLVHHRRLTEPLHPPDRRPGPETPSAALPGPQTKPDGDHAALRRTPMR